ncbi:MAG: threonine--tRNA ligase [Bacteroides sp.]|nr:MAG: threonine--tRNA ligase [Bacteroides sp.]
MIKIKYNNSIIEYPSMITPYEVIKNIFKNNTENVIGVQINGISCDLLLPLKSDSIINILTWNDLEGKKILWHSTAHILAEAIKNIYPNAQLANGPAMNNGFYYDIDFCNIDLKEKNLLHIEKHMYDIIKDNSKFIRIESSFQEAEKYFKNINEIYKIRILKRLENNNITLYQHNKFIDLCKGPHLLDTKHIKFIKLTKISGSYWQKNNNNKQLTRIYGISFPNKEEMANYFYNIKQAKERDHKKIGQKMELFSFNDNVGSGLPLWLPKGNIIREKLINFIQKINFRNNYYPVSTPHIAKSDLYKISGHYYKYKDHTFNSMKHDKVEFLLKPMNCPHHCEIYKKIFLQSYKSLPLRLSEIGTVYRYEQSGELNGLLRSRSFTQDDAHIFCEEEHLSSEFSKIIKIISYVLQVFKLNNFTIQISLHDPYKMDKYIGSSDIWTKSENNIIEICKKNNIKVNIAKGEAAFYGPKIDFMVEDSLKRIWQLGTIQLDFNLAQKFGLEYRNKKNILCNPIIIHRAILGSIERFIAILLENSNGDLPFWISPIQFIILPIIKDTIYINKLFKNLIFSDIYGLIDDRNETLSKKIRDAELKMIPYIIIIGQKEIESNFLSIRDRQNKTTYSINMKEFILKVNSLTPDIPIF